MSENLSRIPRRRFKEFKNADAWEQRKLSELTSLITKGTTPLDKTGNGKINFVKIESIDSSSGEINITSTISEEEHNGYLKRSQLQEGDVLFSIAGTLGRVTSVNKGILPANTNQALAIIRLKSCSLNYITTYLKGKAVSDFVKKNPTVGAQPNLSLEQVGNLEIALPNIDEQERIGTYFQNLDNLITLHQRKLDKLKAMKSAFLTEMFPAQGKRQPRRRFVGFTEDWEQRKVNDLFKVTRGYVLATSNTSSRSSEEAPYPVYSSQTKENGLMGYHKNFLYEDAITWTTDGANAGTVNYRTGKFFCTNVCGVLLSNGVKANQMIAEALNNVTKKYVSYVGNPKLMNNIMAEIEIQLPNQENERVLISEFLCNVDNLITLHQRAQKSSKERK